MIHRLLIATLLAGACSAAEDLVVLRDGTGLVGTVEVDDAQHVVLVTTRGFRVTLDRAQVATVRRGQAPPAVERESPAPVQARPAKAWKARELEAEQRPWTFSAVLAGGWEAGSLSSTGALVDSATAATYDVVGDYDLGGAQALPGLALRLTHDQAVDGPGLRLGMQVGSGAASGESASLQVANLSALAGWTWGSATRRHAVQGLVGWNQGTLDRKLVLKDNVGTTLATVDDSTTLGGYSLGVEAETAWISDAWTWGLLAGLTWSSLSGDASWSSGTYTGAETIDGSLLSLHAGGFVGLRF